MNYFQQFMGPLAVGFVGISNWFLFSWGMKWFETMHRAPFMPSITIINAIWAAIYICVAIALYLLIAKAPASALRTNLIALAMLNLAANLTKGILFSHGIVGWPMLLATLIEVLTVLIIVSLSWRSKPFVALFYAPYLLWSFVDLYQSVMLAILN